MFLSFLHRKTYQRANEVLDYFNELHPKSEEHYRTQQALEGVPIIGSWYGNYMRSRAQAEIQKQNMERLGITWKDIKSPWGASLTSANVNGSIVNGASIVSSNLKRLYR